jgi:hypothetical protein
MVARKALPRWVAWRKDSQLILAALRPRDGKVVVGADSPGRWKLKETAIVGLTVLPV